MGFNPQAEELNSTLSNENQAVTTLLATKGKAAFFPKKGILAQAAEASQCDINATIGIALEDDGATTCLSSISSKIGISEDKAFRYAPSAGVPALRNRWKEMLLEKNPTLASKDISNPVVTSALTHGIFVTAQLFVEAGEEIIAPNYFWGNYRLILENGAGGTINTYTTFTEKGGYNIVGLQEKLSESGVGKKVVILNFPNNPTGYTPTKAEAVALKEALVAEAEKGSSLVVIIDDAYFGLVFQEGIYEESIFSLLSDAHENILAIKVDGPTKEDYVWGFRTGFITYGIKGGTEALYGALEAKTAGVVRGSISNASGLGQHLLLEGYLSESYSSEKAEKFTLLKKRFDKVSEIFENHPEYAEAFTALPYNSGYFMCIRPKAGIDVSSLREKLVKEYSVGLIQVEDLLRVAFSSTPTDKLAQVFDSIYKAIQQS